MPILLILALILGHLAWRRARAATSVARLPFTLGIKARLGRLSAARAVTGPTLPPTTRLQVMAGHGRSLNRSGEHSSRTQRAGPGNWW